MAVNIILYFNDDGIVLPVNPEELEISRSSDNENIDIVGAGKRTRKDSMSLWTTTIESFFPGKNSYWYKGKKPNEYINFIMNIWKADYKNNNVPKIVTTGLPRNLNTFFVIEEFNYDSKAGEEEDIYYTLSLKEYKPYGVKEIEIKNKKTKTKGKKNSRAKANSKKKKSKIYVVQKGDCLWNIAKACTGKGTDWKQLYKLNKKVIGSNPNLIYPGQKLTLPDGWKVPKKVTKLKTTFTSYKYTTKSTGASSKKGNSKSGKSKKVVYTSLKSKTTKQYKSTGSYKRVNTKPNYGRGKLKVIYTGLIGPQIQSRRP